MIKGWSLLGDAGTAAAEVGDSSTDPVVGLGGGRFDSEIDNHAAVLIALDGVGDLGELNPSALLGRLASGDGHDEGDETILARAGRGLVVDEGVDKGDGLLFVGLFVAGHEEVVGEVGVASVLLGVDAGGVGVHIVGLDHGLGAEDLGALIVAVGRLAADVDDGLAATGIADDDVGGVVGLGSGKGLDGLVDVAGARREDLDRFGAHEEAGHVEVVDGHVLEDATAALDVLERGR
mmetsp:Transcript_7866/g.24121  ORF Transcript_7866/g.24121 Transcript_7866/m.24121 type:complete len:235 (-) Transcript_7866:171-875(-)